AHAWQRELEPAPRESDDDPYRTDGRGFWRGRDGAANARVGWPCGGGLDGAGTADYRRELRVHLPMDPPLGSATVSPRDSPRPPVGGSARGGPHGHRRHERRDRYRLVRR